jgi:ferredoxin
MGLPFLENGLYKKPSNVRKGSAMKPPHTPVDEIQISGIIRDFVLGSEKNSLGEEGSLPAFDPPLVGFSNGADPLYEEYVSHIGPFYGKPSDFFRQAFPRVRDLDPAALTVISWILPLTRRTRQEQSAETGRPSPGWIRTRWYGEQFNESLRRHVTDTLNRSGVQAMAPTLSPLWSRSDQGPYAPCSNWSERHAAHAAGLGTFGLCDGLITPVGKAMRTGSVIARLDLSPTPRPYTDHHAWCLYYARGTCGKCMSRCPVNAITPEGHDKKRCMAFVHHAMNLYGKKTLGIDTFACGLCQAAVPCMDHIPDPAEG